MWKEVNNLFFPRFQSKTYAKCYFKELANSQTLMRYNNCIMAFWLTPEICFHKGCKIMYDMKIANESIFFVSIIRHAGMGQCQTMLRSNFWSWSSVRECGICCWEVFRFVTVKENDLNQNRHQRYMFMYSISFSKHRLEVHVTVIICHVYVHVYLCIFDTLISSF